MRSRLILASSSPRRWELLRAMGLDAEQITSSAVEISDGEPRWLAMENARRKAVSVSADDPDAFVLGADTIVVFGGAILGKPIDEDDAARMLGMLQGCEHEVITGVCLARGKSSDTRFGRSSVRFASMTEREIRAYVATGDPLDKAGAYGIQGMMRMYVEEIRGSYDNVMGMPTALARRMLLDAGYEWI
ncbi:MAG: Maf family protein [Oscillospiraceae bacterium]|nr:Maf family protein [Oscillospiraceae bacterium]